MTAASVHEVAGFSIRDLYESPDPNFPLVVQAAIEHVADRREQIAREQNA